MNTNDNSDDPTAVASTTTVVVSAPGKILLAGGYLVLEEANVGVVVAVDKRFYCECRLTRTISSAVATTTVTVESPQFGATWKYQWRDHLLLPVDEQQNNPNPFVEKALRVALLYLQPPAPAVVPEPSSTTTVHQIHLKIAADNDFYSLVPHLQARQWPCDYASAQQLPARLPAARRSSTTSDYYKTGLGSSACLVTAVTAALVQAWQQSLSSESQQQQKQQQTLANTTSSNWIETMARLAQIGHCYAQNKVGSGFDVSAACFGSHVYRRFPAEFLQKVLVVLDHQQSTTTDPRETGVAASSLLRTLVDQSTPWTGGVQSPLHSFVSSTSTASSSKASFLQCLMADVVGGSESPSMARQVLEWRRQQQLQTDQGCCPHWDDLAQLNPRIVSLLQELHQLTGSWTIEELSQRQDELIQCHPRAWSSLDHNPVARVLSELRHTFQECRHHLRAMGQAAGGVPIEPVPQTALCNACQEIPGVVAALVPGAGGYDAVVCV